LFRDVNLNDVDKDGNSPLHTAVIYGRVNNAEVLLRTAKKRSESNDADDQLVYEKFGLASINQMNKSRYYPLHLAVINNYLVNKVFFSMIKTKSFYFLRTVFEYFCNSAHISMDLRVYLQKN
jgi:ankyrin repeat protein